MSSSSTGATQPLLDAAAAKQQIDAKWDDDIVHRLTEYIRIPAKSPAFDPDWAKHGYIEQVVTNAAAWVEAQKVPGLKLEIVQAEGRTPLIFFEVASTKPGATKTALMYGHLDKQPEFTGWHEGLGPWTPKYDADGKLWGRGAADDGYAVYAATTALLELSRQKMPHPRIVGIIEACEESGSPDLLPYIDMLRPRLGDVGLVVCLDSGAGSYDQLWLTTNLRGMASGTLRVEVLTQGVHSGDASGMVPGSFRILRRVLDRLEDSATGRLLPAVLHCDIPAERRAQAEVTAKALGDALFDAYPWAHYPQGGNEQTVLSPCTSGTEALLARTWQPTLTITGAEGLPALKDAGNVLRPYTSLKLSLRLPPLVDGAVAMREVKRVLEADPPYQAKVTFDCHDSATGWNAPAMQPWFTEALEVASQAFFNAPCGYIGQGGTIPLMGQLSEGFPTSQMMVCGVLGPGSNAHGPNEFLHVPYAKKLTACVAEVIARMP
ncbi:MAG: M20/M25/M40 family metallo-hydrolase [Burkholderiaceae bacterium]|nr:MAG: M20/M25/M40 family metallo-hydrolase [Burkholderiaceae bacterium]